MKIIVTNGFLPIIPILLWNVFLSKRLPKDFSSQSFDQGIPKLILIFENILRMFVFFIPLCTRLNIRSSIGQWGLLIFSFGLVCYFGSWILLIKYPNLKWCNSFWGFTAPAYTPLIWLIGLGLMIDSYYFRLSYSYWQYLILSCLFVGIHFTHTTLVFRKKDKT